MLSGFDKVCYCQDHYLHYVERIVQILKAQTILLKNKINQTKYQPCWNFTEHFPLHDKCYLCSWINDYYSVIFHSWGPQSNEKTPEYHYRASEPWLVYLIQVKAARPTLFITGQYEGLMYNLPLVLSQASQCWSWGRAIFNDNVWPVMWFVSNGKWFIIRNEWNLSADWLWYVFAVFLRHDTIGNFIMHKLM